MGRRSVKKALNQPRCLPMYLYLVVKYQANAYVHITTIHTSGYLQMYQYRNVHRIFIIYILYACNMWFWAQMFLFFDRICIIKCFLKSHLYGVRWCLLKHNAKHNKMWRKYFILYSFTFLSMFILRIVLLLAIFLVKLWHWGARGCDDGLQYNNSDMDT